jgi:hypothetical protein
MSKKYRGDKSLNPIRKLELLIVYISFVRKANPLPQTGTFILPSSPQRERATSQFHPLSSRRIERQLRARLPRSLLTQRNIIIQLLRLRSQRRRGILSLRSPDLQLQTRSRQL